MINLKLKEPQSTDLKQIDDYAVVLCGGGAAGRWQAGVLTALAQSGILNKARVLIGTSVGGLNAALFAYYGSNSILNSNSNIFTPIGGADLIEDIKPFFGAIEIWEEIRKNEDVYLGDFNSFFGKLKAIFGFLSNAKSILDPTPLYKKIDTVFGQATLEDIASVYNKHVIISAMDLNCRREDFYTSFSENKTLLVSDVLKRTSAIPGMFRSVKGYDKDSKGKIYTSWHVDGGAGANNPLVALNRYNKVFKPIKKIIIVYCYPDHVDEYKNDSYECFRDALLGTINSMLTVQEQMVEEWAEWIVTATDDYNILALYPSEFTCDSLDFTKTELLQKGYDYATEGKGWSYRDNGLVDLFYFLQKS